MTRRDELNAFLDSLYVPAGLREEVEQLRLIVRENDYRAIESKDTGKMFKDCLVIHTTGKGNRETYFGFHICRVDIGAVGSKMAEIAIHYIDSVTTPRRVAKTNLKINIPM